MFFLFKSDIDLLWEGVRAAFPREASGVLMREETSTGTVLSLRMTSHHENTPLSFVIRDHTLSEIETSLAGTGKRMCGCVHSHVVGRAWPSRRDSSGTKTIGELWLIYSLSARSLRLFEWDGTMFRRQPVRQMARRYIGAHLPARTDTQKRCDDGRNCREFAKPIAS
jgi:proteasome lid subunit RPN8/RPN11